MYSRMLATTSISEMLQEKVSKDFVAYSNSVELLSAGKSFEKQQQSQEPSSGLESKRERGFLSFGWTEPLKEAHWGSLLFWPP